MRGSVLGSSLMHVAMMVVLFVTRGPASLIVPGPDIVQVSLIDPAAAMTQPPAQPEPPKPDPKLAEIKPIEDTGVKLQPEKPLKPKKKEEEREERPTSPAPALPSAPAGSAGLRGEIAVDAGNFEFTYYLVLVRNKVAQNWSPPAGLATGGRPVRAVVYFRISRSGEITGINIESGSNVEFFDRSAVRAVTISDPMPPLPLGYPGSNLGVHFGFEWESP